MKNYQMFFLSVPLWVIASQLELDRHDARILLDVAAISLLLCAISFICQRDTKP